MIEVQLESENFWQPRLRGDRLSLRPLLPDDFSALHQAASDPLIWEQHPDFERYKLERFQRYFESGIASNGALVVIENSTGEIVGSSRYVDHSPQNSSVEIGFTFLVRRLWGGSFNREMKTLMLSHAFRYVTKVFFVVGRENWRSRKAMTKIGGVLVPEGEEIPLQRDLTHSVVFQIDKDRR